MIPHDILIREGIVRLLIRILLLSLCCCPRVLIAGEPVIDGAYPGLSIPAADGLNIFFDDAVDWSLAPDGDAGVATAAADTMNVHVMLCGATASAISGLEFRLRVEAAAPFAAKILSPAGAAVAADGSTFNLIADYPVALPLTPEPTALLSLELVFAGAANREIFFYLEPSAPSTTGEPAYRDGAQIWRAMATLPPGFGDPVVVLNRSYVDNRIRTWSAVKSLFRRQPL